METNQELYERESFIIGDTIIEVWEGQTGWKWQVSKIDGVSQATGYSCESQTQGLLMALSWVSVQSLKLMDAEMYEGITAFYPGLEMFENLVKLG